MKKVLFLIVASAIIQSCATIAGGKRYYAHVKVENDPEAEIYYQGRLQGRGNASFKADRRDANNLLIQVKKKGCADQDFNYYSRVFRGWAFAGTVFTWTGAYFIPWGVIVDGSTGAWWKPDVKESNIQKEDWDNFHYLVSYNGCGQSTGGASYGNWGQEPEDDVNANSKESRLRELKSLHAKGLISDDEYKEQKAKILDE